MPPDETTEDADETVTYVRCVIPEREHYNGPVTRRLMRRSLIGLGAVWGVAALPLVLGASPALKAAGLGLMIPGGGYLYARRPGRAAGSLGASVAAFAVWFTAGNAVLLPAVWLGTAGAAAADLRRAGR
ncbi:MAG: hypothetical protein WKF31_01365 [Thermoleophilaceae bacterium]